MTKNFIGQDKDKNQEADVKEVPRGENKSLYFNEDECEIKSNDLNNSTSSSE